MFSSLSWGQKIERRSYKQALNSVKFINLHSYKPYLQTSLLFRNDYWHLWDLRNVSISPKDNKTVLGKIEARSGYVDMYFPFCYLWNDKPQQVVLEGEISNLADCDSVKVILQQDTLNGTTLQETELTGSKDSTYYVNLCVASEQQLIDGLQVAKGYRNIIFDMRGYPYNIPGNRGNIILGNFLFPDCKTVLRRDYADIEEPGTFLENPDGWGYGKKNPDYYKGHVIVLVNSSTVSQAECIAEIIRNAPDGLAVGEKTAGTLGQVTYVPYINGVWTRYTNYGVYEKNGRNTYPNGVKIDHLVNPQKLDLDKYNDYILEEALKLTK